MQDSSPKRSARLTIAGWLIIFAGLLSLFNGLGALLEDNSSAPTPFSSIGDYSICAFVIVAFGVVAILGGVSALRGKNFTLALAGAALGALGDGIVGVVCGLIALALLFISDQDL